MKIGQRMKQLRKSTGLTQKTVARLTASEQNRVSNYENGRVEPSLPSIRLYAQVYNMTLSEFLEGVE